MTGWADGELIPPSLSPVSSMSVCGDAGLGMHIPYKHFVIVVISQLPPVRAYDN